MSRHTFNPYDHELIGYLNEKITSTGGLATGSEINEVNIFRHEPGEIPGLATIHSTHTWYVISPVEKLKGKCGRTKRFTKTGKWKVTGNPCVVKDVDSKKIGFKRYLVFEEKEQISSSSSSFSVHQPKKNKWKIHEFHSSIRHHKTDDFVLCKLMKTTCTPTTPMATEPSPIITPQPITAPFQTLDGFGEDYCGNLDDYFPQLQSTDWFDPSHDVFVPTNMQDLDFDDALWN